MTEAVQVSSDDRGLSYGDGLFETMRMAAGGIPLWTRHRARLLEGAQRLAIDVSLAELDAAVAQQCVQGGNAIIKLLLTRGRGGRGYSAPAEPAPTLLLQRHPLSLPPVERYSDGLSVGICDLHLASQPALAGMKHLNRLEQVLARRQVDSSGWQEGLLLGAAEEPLELTAMNLFARFGEQLWTPDLSQAGVAGVMRSHILETLAPALGLSVQVSSLELSQLQRADELFACNSVAGVVPIRKLALWSWPVGNTALAMQQQIDELFSGD